MPLFPLLLALAALLMLSGCASPGVRSTQRTFNTVIVDAGHGGKDSGAVRNGLREKNCTLATAELLSDQLQKAGYRVVMTRDDDTFIPLNTRPGIANHYANAIFVSIHYNDSPRRSIHGAEVYFNSFQAIPLAQNILQSLRKTTNARYMKPARFRVLRLNRLPAVLVECGYLSNRSEAARCGSESFRRALAQQIAAGIADTRQGN